MLTTLLVGLGLLWATGAWALTPPTPQFGFTGFIQEATLDTAGAICIPKTVDAAGNQVDATLPLVPGTPAARLAGGTITVNGIKMIVPCNTILQMPAATFTWGDLFDPANSTPVGSYIGAATGAVPANPTAATVAAGVSKIGLALADSPMPFPSFAVSVTGNVVDGKYIAALILPIEQQVLNGGSGIVTFIDYTNGSFRVGGILNDPNCAAGNTGCSGALLQINDPGFVVGTDPITGAEVRDGRWGKAHSIDPRFSGDNENVTVHASTGIPVCIPRVAPPAIDPLCPLKNRPLNGSAFGTDPFLATGAPLKNFTMPTPAAADADPTLPDPRQQVPIMVGDQVVWVGTVYRINPLATVTDPVTGALVPDTTPANTYISAHTVEDVLGIFTQPGVPPAYVFIEAFLIGSGGQALPGLLQEASTRLTVVGFTTDPTRLVDIYAQDINPCTGQESLRLLATTDPATQPLVGRFVHRVLGGLFMPPTRYYVMKSRTQFVDPLTQQPLDPQPLVANGIAPGQYLLPNFEYVIPENHRLGDPFIPGNFQDFPFLALGSGPLDGFGTSATSPVVGQLSPWPGIPTPAAVNCANFGATPIVNAGADRAVATGTTVTLNGIVNWDANSTSRTATWVNVAPDGTLTPLATTVTTVGNTSTVTASFTAPATPTTLTFRLDATDSFGTGSDSVNITVLQPTDTVQFVVATFVIQRGPRGDFGKLTVQATTSDPTALLSLSQVNTAGQFTDWGAGSNTPSNPTVFDWVEIKGASQPASLTITSSKGGTATVTCGALDARGRLTCP